eukprot:731764-Alexandrium_andersonii.AAC.1
MLDGSPEERSSARCKFEGNCRWCGTFQRFLRRDLRAAPNTQHRMHQTHFDSVFRLKLHNAVANNVQR